MYGIDLDQPIRFVCASLRFFSENEKHVNRICYENVLLLVYEGILRFTEDGIDYEIHPGEYHIQRANSLQAGNVASSRPKYLYIHFHASWADSDNALPVHGFFDYRTFEPYMKQLDNLFHNNGSLLDMTLQLLTILSLLRERKDDLQKPANLISAYLLSAYTQPITLEMLCRRFHYSKNHIINLFKAEYGITPFEYIDNLRLTRVKHLMEVTSDSVESIIQDCGFSTYSHFFRLFRRKNGMSPTEWRTKKRLQPANMD